MATWRLVDGQWVDTSIASNPTLTDGLWVLATASGSPAGPPLPEETGLIDGVRTTLENLGYTGSVPQMLVDFYKANGATADSLQTAEYQFLLARGMTSNTIADMWVEYFRSLGYTPSFHEGMKDFWVRNGGSIT